MKGGNASCLPRLAGTSTSTQSPSSPVSHLPVTVKRSRRISFSSIDSTPLVRGPASSKTAKVNDHQTTGKAKVAVTQSVTSRSASSHHPTVPSSSAELDRASHVGDKIKRRLATNVNTSATSVSPAISVPPATSVLPVPSRRLVNSTNDTTDGTSSITSVPPHPPIHLLHPLFLVCSLHLCCHPFLSTAGGCSRPVPSLYFYLHRPSFR